MLKQIVLQLAVFFNFLSGVAQVPLHDKVWIQGGAEIIKMTFEEDSIHYFTTLDRPSEVLYYKAHSNICDSSGALQFSFDGGDIITKEHYIMDGGYKIVPVKFYQRYYGHGFYNQSSIILPLHGANYMLIYASVSDPMMEAWYRASGPDSTFYDLLGYAIVDMNANSGLGRVSKSQQVIMDKGYMDKTNMMACRHANGRDWWLLKKLYQQNSFYTFLITAYGDIIDKGVQWFPRISPFDLDHDVDGQCMFSSDGSKFASVVQHRATITLFDFDRCTGLLSNLQTINVPTLKHPRFPTEDESGTTVGISFSPKGRFLYVSSEYSIQQYDTWATDSISAWYHVAGIDTTIEQFNVYSSIYPAPNGKLYIGNWHGMSKQMSRIDHPDSKGMACVFCAKCDRPPLQWGAATAPPCMPNYRLGALSGSPCDTLHPPPPSDTLSLLHAIVPNAFSPNNDGRNDTWHILNVAALQAMGVQFLGVKVFNRQGNEVFQSSDIQYRWDGAQWASDTYYYYLRFRTKNGKEIIQRGDVIVVR